MVEIAEVKAMVCKETILENVRYKLVNAKMYAKKLLSMPCMGFLDLAAVCFVEIENEYGKVAFDVTSGLCEEHGIDEDELDKAAWRNTWEKGFRMQTLGSFLDGMKGMDGDVDAVIEAYETEDGRFWMAYGDRYGAAVMLYNGYFDVLASILGGDLYVIPSSVHEVTAAPADGGNPNYLSALVKMVNGNFVSGEELLSGNVYRYIRGESRFVIEQEG